NKIRRIRARRSGDKDQNLIHSWLPGFQISPKIQTQSCKSCLGIQVLVVVLALRRELDGLVAAGLRILEDFAFVIADHDFFIVVRLSFTPASNTLWLPSGMPALANRSSASFTSIVSSRG